jgi:hypothetical protein
MGRCDAVSARQVITSARLCPTSHYTFQVSARPLRLLSWKAADICGDYNATCTTQLCAVAKRFHNHWTSSQRSTRL